MSNMRRNQGAKPASEKAHRTAITVEHQSFSGPLPPPALLEHYNAIQPDFAERLLKMTEAEAAHRHRTVDRAMTLSAIETFLGQVFGLIVALAGFATTIWLGLAGQTETASIVGGTTVVGLVTVFVVGRKTAPKDD